MGQRISKQKEEEKPFLDKRENKEEESPKIPLLPSIKSTTTSKTKSKSKPILYLNYIPSDQYRETLLERWESGFPTPFKSLRDIPSHIKIQWDKGSISVKKRLEEIISLHSVSKFSYRRSHTRSRSKIATMRLFQRLYIVRTPIHLSLGWIYEEVHYTPHDNKTVYHQTYYPIQDGFTTQFLSKKEWLTFSKVFESTKSVADEPKSVWLNQRLLYEKRYRYKGKTQTIQ
jgi:hypothetical protein